MEKQYPHQPGTATTPTPRTCSQRAGPCFVSLPAPDKLRCARPGPPCAAQPLQPRARIAGGASRNHIVVSRRAAKQPGQSNRCNGTPAASSAAQALPPRATTAGGAPGQPSPRICQRIYAPSRFPRETKKRPAIFTPRVFFARTKASPQTHDPTGKRYRTLTSEPDHSAHDTGATERDTGGRNRPRTVRYATPGKRYGASARRASIRGDT